MNQETLCLELRHLLGRLEEMDSGSPTSEVEYKEILERIRQVTRILESFGGPHV